MESLLQNVRVGLRSLRHARGFAIKGDSVEILESPSQFYNVLLQGVRNARSRVVIASSRRISAASGAAPAASARAESMQVA